MAGLALPRPHAPPGALRSRFALLREEFARRRSLARRPQPEGVSTPGWRLLFGELLTYYESWREWRRIGEGAFAPGERSAVVMLLPGFGTHPGRMRRLHRALARAGHRVVDWGLGWNMGGTAEGLDRLCRQIATTHARAGEPLVLVGWSLGGLYAREAAKRVPDAVRLVITMGSPFSGDLHANNAWRAYHWITGQDVAEPPVDGDYEEKPPVPTFALWSPRDGIVSPRSARGRPGERDAAIALRCTHIGFASHPSVAREVLRILDRT